MVRRPSAARLLALTLAVALVHPCPDGSRAAEPLTGTPARSLVEQWLAAQSKKSPLALDFVQERQLKTLRRPLSRHGQLWVSPAGGFRWQIDEPASLLLIREKTGSPLVWIDRKKAVYRVLRDEPEAADGQTASLRFLLHSQAPDWTTFDRVFHLRQATPLESPPGVWRLALDLRDRRASLAVKEALLEVEPATGALQTIELQLRDGSVLRTRITRVQVDPSFPTDLFIPPLTGLKPEAS